MRSLRAYTHILILITILLSGHASLASAIIQPGSGELEKIARITARAVQLTPGIDQDENISSRTSTLSQTLFIPLANRTTGVPLFELSAWTENGDGNKSYAFLPNQPLRFRLQIKNNTNQSAQITLHWFQRGPCDTVILFNESLEMGSNPIERTYPDLTNECFGVYVNQIQILYKDELFNTFFNYIVAPASDIVIGGNQGFDRCDLPSLDAMQTWWESSPYYTYNLYLGGISLGCSISRLNPTWVYSAARQGWTFILTWVGPQAPCTRFKYRMDPDPDDAYLEGRKEADMAAGAAERLGFMGDRVIYYDIEAYSGADQACRDTVASFVRGWVERLHELGFHGGAYGAPCSSYISDWAEISPPPDDVWIAHWFADGYDPSATVWDAPCLSNSLWANHQRIKQYIGSHDETWGGVTLRIDSDVLDGEIVALPGVAETLLAPIAPEPSSATVIYTQPRLRAMELVAPNTGWTILADQLLWSEDGGATWQDITPFPLHNSVKAQYRLLTADFLDGSTGMAVLEREQDGAIFGYVIREGGQIGETNTLFAPISEKDIPVQAVYLDYVDENTAFVAFRLRSSSAFSLGKLFVTEDGGRTWQERSLPAGEAVTFLDAHTGWTTGRSPSGTLLYRTTDGGHSWELQSLPLSFPEMTTGLPKFLDDRHGLLPVVLPSQGRSRLFVLQTVDKGETWEALDDYTLPGATTGSEVASFSVVSPTHRWILSNGKILSLGLDGQFSTFDLSAGVIALDFWDEQQGWALVQQGICQGVKEPLRSAERAKSDPLICQQITRLMKTVNGGKNWVEISPIPPSPMPMEP